jgi:hypothetical protein
MNWSPILTNSFTPKAPAFYKYAVTFAAPSLSPIVRSAFSPSASLPSPGICSKEMEEKEHVNQILHLISSSEQCLFILPDALMTITRKKIAPLPISFQETPTLVPSLARRRMR